MVGGLDLEGEREGNLEGIMDVLGIKLGKLLGTLEDLEGEREVDWVGAVVGGAVGGGHPIFPPALKKYKWCIWSQHPSTTPG